MSPHEGQLRAALEAALLEDPDDPASHAAYADVLMSSDDPADQARGEFIQVQMALEEEELSSQERKRFRVREQALLARHEREWLGGLAPFLLDPQPELDWIFDLYELPCLAEHRFQRGWLHRLEIHYLPLQMARAIRDAPACRLLQELVIEAVDDGSTDTEPEPEDQIPERDHSIGLCPLQAAELSCLRKLQIGFVPQSENPEWYSCKVHSSIIPDLCRKLPRLEELYLFANMYDVSELFSLPLTELRILQVYHVDGVHRLQNLANNPAMENLTHLLIHPHYIAWHRNEERDEQNGYREIDGYLPLSVVRPLLYSSHLPSLTHLRLRVSSLGNDGCQEIVRSGILKRLKMLDLRHGRITDPGAQILAKCKHLKNLEWLDLDRNSIGSKGIRAIKATGASVQIDDQHPRDELHSDIPQYLTEGEFE